MPGLNGQSGDPNVPGVVSENMTSDFGLVGNSNRDTSVHLHVDRPLCVRPAINLDGGN
jgi:hypothetical protein